MTNIFEMGWNHQLDYHEVVIIMIIRDDDVCGDVSFCTLCFIGHTRGETAQEKVLVKHNMVSMRATEFRVNFLKLWIFPAMSLEGSKQFKFG